MTTEERYSRQSSLVPAKIKDIPITVVGCGAIGRNVAIQLTAMGAKNLCLYDFDTVEESNIASQGFFESQLGMTKIDAVAESCRNINKDIRFELINKKFLKSSEVRKVVFMCVDTMESREIISGATIRQEVTEIVIDGRMAGETARVLSFRPFIEKECQYYQKTIVPDEVAYDGPCTAKSTIYCSNIISGFMISVFTKWLRKIERDRDFVINIMANEIFLN